MTDASPASFLVGRSEKCSFPDLLLGNFVRFYRIARSGFVSVWLASIPRAMVFAFGFLAVIQTARLSLGSAKPLSSDVSPARKS